MKNFLGRVSPVQWAGLILTVLVIVFVLINRQSTDINLFGLTVSGPQWFILLTVFIVGWLVGVLTSSKRNRKSM